MTLPSEPSDDLAVPRDPASYGPPRHLFSRGFIFVMLFGLLCIAAGAAFTLLVPKLWPAKAAAPPAAASPEVVALQARVQALETGQSRTVDAAAASLAASALAEAAQSSRPFDNELASLERALPLSADLRDLRRLAVTGAPTRLALAAGFDAAAAKASVALHDPGPDAGPLAKFFHALSSIIVIRRLDDVSGKGPDAALARAGRQASDGDLEGALAGIRTLPPKAQDAFADWRAKAQARVEIDRRVAAVRQAALSDLMTTARNR